MAILNDFIERHFLILSTFLVPVLFLIMAPAFHFYYSLKRHQVLQHKSQESQVQSAQLRRELTYSFITLIIFTLSGYGVYLLYIESYTVVYLLTTRADLIYIPVSIVLMMLFHDTYFYWTHRLLHLPGWYQKIHTVHHLSTNPSPFTSLAFHPVEAIIQAGVLPLMVMIVPAHPVAILCFLVYMVVKNVRGHAGYEFTSRSYRDTGWRKLKGYPIHHNIHHLKGRDNYGLYFTMWDRLMGTFRG